MIERVTRERYGIKAAERVTGWREMINRAVQYSEKEQLTAVNSFLNRNIQFSSDMEVWGKEDYWSTPLELLRKGAGDCEDFAIAKYIALRKLGIPDEKLRLIYVRAQTGDPSNPVIQAHMVLGYYAHPTDIPLILDNLISSIQPATQRTDLFPVFSFNSGGLWVGGSHASSADPTARLSHWRNVLDRIRKDGL